MVYLLIIVPLLAVVLLNLPWKKELVNPVAFFLALFVCLMQAAWVVGPDFAGSARQPDDLLQFLHGTALGKNMNLSRVMFLAISLLGFVSLLVARYTENSWERLFVFANVLLLALAGMNGIVLAADLFSLYVFLEVVAVSSFVLIVFDHSVQGFEGAFKYFVLSALASALLLSGVGLFFLVCGDVSFNEVGRAFSIRSSDPLMLGALALLFTGLFIKAGLVPFHGWVPDAYTSAPSATSVLLAGIITKTTGVYTLIRLCQDVFVARGAHWQTAILALGTASMLVGALAALVQSDFKRMLAYSSISQVGYIFLGLGCRSTLGMAGAIFHLFNHAIFKGLLFVNAAAVEKESGTRRIADLGGLANNMPVTGVTSVIGFFSTAGIPPLAGFWSKVMIIVALWQAGYEYLAAAAVLGSVITLAYFLVLQRRVFYGVRVPSLDKVREGNLWVTAPAVLLAAITLGVGIAFPWLMRTFLVPIQSFL